MPPWLSQLSALTSSVWTKTLLSHLQADSTWEITRHLSWSLFSMTGLLEQAAISLHQLIPRWRWQADESVNCFKCATDLCYPDWWMFQFSKVVDIHWISTLIHSMYSFQGGFWISKQLFSPPIGSPIGSLYIHLLIIGSLLTWVADPIPSKN